MSARDGIGEDFRWIVDSKNFSISPDKLIEDRVNLNTTSTNDFNPFHLERNVETTREIIERVQRYRRDIQELSEAAFSAAVEYSNSSALNKVSRDLELSGVNADNNSAQRDLIIKKWEIVSQRLDYLSSRHAIPGHVLNYSERLAPIVHLLGIETTELLDRFRAIQVGMDVRYSLTEPLPHKQKEYDYFQRYFLWFRNVLYAISSRQSGERQVLERYSMKETLGEEAFVNSLESGKFIFNLDRIDNCIITGVSSSIETGWNYGRERWMRSIYSKASITPPEIKYTKKQLELLAPLSSQQAMEVSVSGVEYESPASEWQPSWAYTVPDIDLGFIRHDNGTEPGKQSSIGIYGMPHQGRWVANVGPTYRKLNGGEVGKPSSVITDIYVFIWSKRFITNWANPN